MTQGLVAGCFQCLGGMGPEDDHKAWAKKLIEQEREGELLGWFQREMAYSALGIPMPKRNATSSEGGREPTGDHSWPEEGRSDGAADSHDWERVS